jgi:uroporphyrinogen-III synthase
MLRAHTYRARKLRAQSTEAERALWDLLRGRKLAGLKFRRQQPLGPYIVDFFCDEAALVIEADGPIHIQKKEQDRERDAYLSAFGIVVLRFTNDEIFEQPRGVLRRIVREVQRVQPECRHPSPAGRRAGDEGK